jgi:hypothetical protein
MLLRCDRLLQSPGVSEMHAFGLPADFDCQQLDRQHSETQPVVSGS